MNTFQMIWKVICFRKWAFFINLILFVLFTTLSMGTGLIISELFKTLTGDSSISTNFLIVGVLALAVARIVTNVFSLFTWGIIQFGYLLLLRKNMLRNIIRGGKSNGTGDTMNRIRDDAYAVIHYLEYWIDGTAALIFCSVSITILCSIDPVLTALILLPLCGVLFVAKLLNQRIEKYYKLSRDSDGSVVNFLEEVLGGISSIKLASAEGPIMRRFEKLNKLRQTNGVKNSTMVSILGSINDNISSLTIGGIMFIAAGSMRAGDFSVGEFVLFVNYLTQIAQYITKFGWFTAKHKTVQISIDRMRKLTEGQNVESLVTYADDSEERETHATESLKVLSLKDVTFEYPDSKRGVYNVDLTVSRGELVVITGRIGSGKSTLLKVLQGLLKTDQGALLWNGKVIQNPLQFFQPPVSSYTPQVPRLFSETVRENILLGIDVDAKQLNEAIYTAVLDEDLEGMEKGLDTLVGPKGVKMSGGQSQRIAIARMLVRNSELFLMDDISSALDVDTEKKLIHRLKELKEVTCIVVSNRTLMFEKADRIVFMEDGQIVDQGNVKELIERSEGFRSLYRQPEKSMN
ncbi:ABC transporter ATP-binding protein [Paenibacillus amylolyticus]|uniref:ABC transporter ATP-binding protein n=1 Tax=Paenibacillus amylolyticus TaxID=1451 RepID=UPI003EB85173